MQAPFRAAIVFQTIEANENGSNAGSSNQLELLKKGSHRTTIKLPNPEPFTNGMLPTFET
jgi:hypothetical protein